MDLKQLEAFVAVVQYKSFSKAAASIHLTQPTVSAHIKSLEKEMDAELLDRSAKDILPTKRGRMVFDYAVSILKLRENLVNEAKEDHLKNVDYELRIAASAVPAQYLLPKYLSSFKQNKRNVHTCIYQSDSIAALEDLRNGLADIAIVGRLEEDPKLRYTAITEDEMIIILPNTNEYLKYGENAGNLSFMKDVPFVLREEGSGTRKGLEEFLKEQNLSIDKLNVVCQLGSTESIKQAVAEGMGISVISKIAASDYERFGMLRTAEMKPNKLKGTFYLVTYKERFLSKGIKEFIEYVKNYKL